MEMRRLRRKTLSRQNKSASSNAFESYMNETKTDIITGLGYFMIFSPLKKEQNNVLSLHA